MRIIPRPYGVGFVPLLVVAAIILIGAPIVMWAVGVALNLLWLAVKICVVLLVLLFALFFIKVMARKVKS